VPRTSRRLRLSEGVASSDDHVARRMKEDFVGLRTPALRSSRVLRSTAQQASVRSALDGASAFVSMVSLDDCPDRVAADDRIGGALRDHCAATQSRRDAQQQRTRAPLARRDLTLDQDPNRADLVDLCAPVVDFRPGTCAGARENACEPCVEPSPVEILRGAVANEIRAGPPRRPGTWQPREAEDLAAQLASHGSLCVRPCCCWSAKVCCMRNPTERVGCSIDRPGHFGPFMSSRSGRYRAPPCSRAAPDST